MSKKKKILVFIDWFLPGYKAGGPIRSVANMIDALHEYFDFYIVTSDRDYLEKEPYPEITKDKWLNFESKATVYYFSETKKNKKNLIDLINNIDCDIAYINGIYSFFFSILPLRLIKKTGKKIIVAPRGMLSKQAFSAKQFKKKIFIFIAKLFGLYKDVNFQATDKKEALDIKTILSNNANINVVPNFPRITLTKEPKQIIKQKGELKLVSIARISAEKNTLYALQILASTDFSGKIEYDLFGSIYNNKYWKECNKIINLLPKNIKVNYKNSIESSMIHKTFLKYHFAFMPSKGENFGHSILESFSAGCPVIISDQTPWRDLEDKNVGWDIALSEKSKFIDTIQKCIDMKQEEYKIMSEKAFNFAKECTNNELLISDTKNLFKNE
ncbi:MAG: glycosyltransferase [Bacteroidales bacterium]|nr:glycosyltransferase [Bacteroidales bacterium]